VPLPFGRCGLVMGAPLWVSPRDRGEALEATRQTLENRLNSLFECSRNLFRKA
jgi:lysophospholipid acyltransferase (LPLAT)-like uncharacterized protein